MSDLNDLTEEQLLALYNDSRDLVIQKIMRAELNSLIKVQDIEAIEKAARAFTPGKRPRRVAEIRRDLHGHFTHFCLSSRCHESQALRLETDRAAFAFEIHGWKGVTTLGYVGVTPDEPEHVLAEAPTEHGCYHQLLGYLFEGEHHPSFQANTLPNWTKQDIHQAINDFYNDFDFPRWVTRSEIEECLEWLDQTLVH